MPDTDFLSPAAAYSNTLETLMLQREKSAMEMAKLQMEREKHAADIEDSRQDRELRRMLLQQQQEDRRAALADKKTAAEAAVEEKQRAATANMLANQKMGDVLMPEDAERAEKYFPGRLVNPKQPLRDFAEKLPIGSPERAGIQSQLDTPPLETMVKERVPLRYIGAPAERAKADLENKQRQFIANSAPDRQRALEGELLGFKDAGGDEALDLSPAGLDMAAKMYAQTAQLPPMGYGNRAVALRERIVNRAAEYDATTGQFVSGQPGYPNLAGNKADFQANTGALVQLQKNLSAVSAFSETAKLNAGLLNDMLGKLPDTGVTWLNEPWRALNRGFGNENMAEFNILMQSVRTEYARAINNPNLTGALTDSARKEIEPGLADNATAGQVKRAVEVFARETANREQAVKNEMERVRTSIRGGPAETGGKGGGAGTGGGAGNAGGLPASKVFAEGPYKGRTGYLRPDGKTYSLTPPARPNEAAAPTGAAAVPAPAPVVAPPPSVAVPPPAPVAPAFEGGKLASADEMMPPPGVPVVRRSSVPASIPAPEEPTIPPILQGANRPIASTPLAPQPVTPGPAPAGTLRLAPGKMRLSPQGVETLRTREGGFYGEPYEDSGTGLAIGYGMHTWKGKPVTADLRITEREANLELERQVAMVYAPMVDKALKVPVTQDQYDALITLTWNSPVAARQIIEKLNRGETLSEADFQRSATIKGQPNRGLAGRRSQEFAPFAE